MPELNVVTAAQMRALTDVGLAHPHDENVVAFTYYDGSWWAFAARENDDQDELWFRADDADLAPDITFSLTSTAINWDIEPEREDSHDDR